MVSDAKRIKRLAERWRQLSSVDSRRRASRVKVKQSYQQTKLALRRSADQLSKIQRERAAVRSLLRSLNELRQSSTVSLDSLEQQHADSIAWRDLLLASAYRYGQHLRMAHAIEPALAASITSFITLLEGAIQKADRLKDRLENAIASVERERDAVLIVLRKQEKNAHHLSIEVSKLTARYYRIVGKSRATAKVYEDAKAAERKARAKFQSAHNAFVLAVAEYVRIPVGYTEDPSKIGVARKNRGGVKYDFYFGGRDGTALGPKHGHYVLNSEFGIEYRRDPGEPHNHQKVLPQVPRRNKPRRSKRNRR